MIMQMLPRTEILIELHDNSNRLVEGRITGEDGEPLETFVASLQQDRAGAITRGLIFRTPLVDPSPTWDDDHDSAPGSARAVLDAYFEHLGQGRFEQAADCFSEDCLYSHPP